MTPEKSTTERCGICGMKVGNGAHIELRPTGRLGRPEKWAYCDTHIPVREKEYRTGWERTSNVFHTLSTGARHNGKALGL